MSDTPQFDRGYPTTQVRENVLQEADRITSVDRANIYGSASQNAETWAQLFSAATGLNVRPEHYPICMICVKLARLGGSLEHRDSIVDIAGYARVAEKIMEGD